MNIKLLLLLPFATYFSMSYSADELTQPSKPSDVGVNVPLTLSGIYHMLELEEVACDSEEYKDLYKELREQFAKELMELKKKTVTE